MSSTEPETHYQQNRAITLFRTLNDCIQGRVAALRNRLYKFLQRVLPVVVVQFFGLTLEEKAHKKANEGDENEERGNWSNQAEFVISCVGYAVGLGNIWRFPYLCYRNGGGAFLVMYWILSALVGFPIMVAEQTIGQYTSRGPLHCWQHVPIITGVGLSMVAVSFLTTAYYDIIITWATFYLFSSFTSELAWERCDFSSWADYRCEMQRLDCMPGGEHVRGVDGLCYNISAIGSLLKGRHYPSLIRQKVFLPTEIITSITRNTSTVLGVWNESLASENGVNSVLASEQYYHNYVLRDGDPTVGWNNFGHPRWELVLCLLLIWVIVFLSLIKGIKSSGKVIYVTALAPVVVLVILIIRGVTLPGAYEGIMFFLTPDFERIKNPEVWYQAAGQLFYSLNVCWGGVITLSSYNRFQNNVIRDSLIVVFADTLTSLAASFAIFSVIGYGAYILERPVPKVVEAGTGLAFIVYPKVLSQLPGAVGFSIIFFVMLICLGLSTLVNDVNTVYTSFLDWFPVLRKEAPRTTLFVVCVVTFLIGLSFLCPGGPVLLQIFDEYIATWAVLLVGILQTTSLCWIYGFKRYTKDLQLMMPWIPSIPAYVAEIVLWGFITPGVLAFIMVFIWIEYKPRPNPVEEGIGWFLTWFVAIWMPATAIWVVATRKGTFRQRLVKAISPTKKWGPYLDRFRKQADHLVDFNKNSGIDLSANKAISTLSSQITYRTMSTITNATVDSVGNLATIEMNDLSMVKRTPVFANNSSSSTLNSLETTVNSQVGIIIEDSRSDIISQI